MTDPVTISALVFKKCVSADEHQEDCCCKILDIQEGNILLNVDTCCRLAII